MRGRGGKKRRRGGEGRRVEDKERGVAKCWIGG